MHVELISEAKMYLRNVKKPRMTLLVQMALLKKWLSKAGFHYKLNPSTWLADGGELSWKPIKAACLEHCGEACGFLVNSISFLLMSLCYFLFNEMHWLLEIKQYYFSAYMYSMALIGTNIRRLLQVQQSLIQNQIFILDGLNSKDLVPVFLSR